MSQLPFKKLQIWQKAVELAKNVYKYTQSFPQEEKYGLSSQMQRAAVSVASNIAEGSQRNSDKDFARFISIARGSLSELETQLILAKEFRFASEACSNDIEKEIDELNRMLYVFLTKLSTNR